MITQFAELYRYPMMHDRGVDWLDGIFVLLFLGLLMAVAVLIARALTRDGTTHTPAPKATDALQIARERYAKGEISKDEFVEIRTELQRDTKEK